METADDRNIQHDMHQLVYEFLEQSLEEARAGYCRKIEVAFFSENSIRIIDNGRSLPYQKIYVQVKLYWIRY